VISIRFAGDQLAEANHVVAQKKIILYGRPACSMVRAAQATLERTNADFEYVDIYQVLQARERVREINHGYESVPTLLFPDGSTLTEPSVAELKTKLEGLGYEIQAPIGAGWIRRIFQHPLARLLGVGLLLAGMLSETYWLLFLGVFVLTIGLLSGRL
jgi:mycoredoxin